MTSYQDRLWLIVSIVPLSILGLSAVAVAQSLQSQLKTGVYFGQGTMFNHSHREILSQGNKLCIRIINGPASPYRSAEDVTVSSVSLINGSLYVDADQTQLTILRSSNINSNDPDLAFSHTGMTDWIFRGNEIGGLKPEMDPDLQACIASPQVYIRTYKGNVVGKGVPFPTEIQQPEDEIPNIKEFSNFLYSFRYPLTWIIDTSDNRLGSLTLWSQSPPVERIPGQAPIDLIKTEIALREDSFDQVVEGLSISGGTKLSQKNLELNGMRAVRSYWTNSQFDFPDSIITIVQHSASRVATISSYYDTQNPSAENQILYLHNSFQNTNPRFPPLNQPVDSIQYPNRI